MTLDFRGLPQCQYTRQGFPNDLSSQHAADPRPYLVILFPFHTPPQINTNILQ